MIIRAKKAIGETDRQTGRKKNSNRDRDKDKI